MTCNSTETHTECIVMFPLQNSYTNAPQCYVIRTVLVLCGCMDILGTNVVSEMLASNTFVFINVGRITVHIVTRNTYKILVGKPEAKEIVLLCYIWSLISYS